MQRYFRAFVPFFLFLTVSIGAYAQFPSITQPVEITGQVRLPNGAPAYDVLVRLEESTGGYLAEIPTDRLGKFQFRGLVPKQYRVTVRQPGFREVVREVNLVMQFSDYIQVLLVAEAQPRDRQAPLSVININIAPEAQAEYATAQSLIDQGDPAKLEAAIPHLEQALKLAPKYLEAELALGFVYMDLKKWDQAERALLAATNINPASSTAYFALGDLYRRQKKYVEGEKALLDGLKLYDLSAASHSTLAKLYWEMAPSQKDEAAFKAALGNSWKQVRRALELDPKLADAHLLAGNLLLKARRADAALTHFEEYVKLAPTGESVAEARSMVEKIKQALQQSGKN